MNAFLDDLEGCDVDELVGLFDWLVGEANRRGLFACDYKPDMTEAVSALLQRQCHPVVGDLG